MLNIKQLQKLHSDRQKLKLEPYKKILEMICAKIVETSTILAKDYCIFEVPEIIIGYSLYEMEDCCNWLKKELIKLGINKVEKINDNILVIKWSHI